MASRNPKSPTLVTMNAFLAAFAADERLYQNPISRYEHRPTSSQNTNTWMTLDASTRPTMDMVNSDIYAKYLEYPRLSSSLM